MAFLLIREAIPRKVRNISFFRIFFKKIETIFKRRIVLFLKNQVLLAENKMKIDRLEMVGLDKGAAERKQAERRQKKEVN